jgi:hypothetical protein
MVHYAIQITLKHPGFFSPTTSVEIDVNIEASPKDIQRLEKYIKICVER